MNYYYHFLVNPVSGSGRGKKAVERVQKIVKKHRFPPSSLFNKVSR